MKRRSWPLGWVYYNRGLEVIYERINNDDDDDE
jgi:hypothetical protein